ncbi:MAG: FAD-dependent oxidoreductase [Thermoleophilia bacterium]|nr:FAD-dependent oxidoreductase [Thermoleophilia bacterium]
MKLEDSTKYTSSCFRGEPAPCSFACPFHMDIRSFLEKAGKGRWMAAYKTLRNATVFPVIVAALCDQPCRDCCQRTVLGDEAIAVRDVESAVLRNTKDRRPDSYVIPPKTQRVAVVGAGVAGLSAALNLAQKKYPVTVFEKQEGWGGSLRSHPRFAEFDADIALQFSAVEADFRFGVEVKSLDELADFDAVYVATGVGGDDFGLLESWDRELLMTSDPKVFMGGTLTGATLMEGIAQGIEVSKTLEVFLQTGKANLTHGAFNKQACERYFRHDGAVSVPLVVASGPDGYTADEAKAEAARCLLCDCDTCIATCEMLKRFRKDPQKIGLEVYTDMNVNPPFSVRALTREAYSCNICGYCKSVCPVDVDIGSALQLSRTARMSAGVHPAALHDFWLREMDFATSEAAFASAPKGKETCEYAFYPGCQLGAANPEHVLRSYDFLSRAYDAGIMLGCCGAPAYWAGDESRLQANIEATRQGWTDLGKPTLVFACATCMSLFGRFLPEIPRVSLYELLAVSDEIAPVSPFTEATVFDPCAARDDDGMESGVRTLAAKAGVALEELAEPNHCCGYGGHMRIANPTLYDEITQHRAEASDKPYIVYCANCREVFASRGKDSAHVLDLAFGLDAGAGVPSLLEKRENSLEVKRELMKQIKDVEFHPEKHPWDGLTLLIGDELQRDLDYRLISAADLKEAIWQAESAGEKFYDESAGTCMASLVKPVITFWVEYRETAPQTYEILSAYYHRMRFERGE